MPIGWQIILRCDDDRVLAPTTAHRRRMARSIGRVARPFELLAWSAPDTHLHALVVGERPEAGELARRLLIGPIQVLGHPVRWERARIRPVEDQRHLRHSFRYVLRQADHHGATSDPWLETTSLADPVGLRIPAQWTRAVVRRHLPRTRDEDLRALLPDAARHPSPRLLPDLLLDAAGAAAGLPTARLRSRETRRVLAAATAVGCDATDERTVRTALRCRPRSFRRLRTTPLPTPLATAIAAQGHLRSQAAPPP